MTVATRADKPASAASTANALSFRPIPQLIPAERWRGFIGLMASERRLAAVPNLFAYCVKPSFLVAHAVVLLSFSPSFSIVYAAILEHLRSKGHPAKTADPQSHLLEAKYQESYKLTIYNICVSMQNFSSTNGGVLQKGRQN